jgi:exopolysaccharide biosynthesis polyprenyl glycosylphosphotransferase
MAYSTKHYLSQSEVQSSTVGRNMSQQLQRNLYLGAIFIVDMIMLKLAFSLAHWIRFSSGLEIFNEGMVAPERYAFFSLICIGLWVGIFLLFQTYDWENLLGGTQEYALVAHACTFATVGVMVTNFLWPFLIARGWLLLAWMLTFLFVAIGRFSLRHIAYKLRSYGFFVVPALIVGNNDEGRALTEQLMSWRTSGLNIVGIVDEQSPAREQAAKKMKIRTFRDLEDLPNIVEKYQIEELILTTSALSSQQILEIFRRYSNSRKVNVRLSSGLFDVITTGLKVKSLGYVPLISVDKFRLSPLEEFLKKCLDKVGAAVALLMLSPLLIAVALAVSLSSPGPIIHRRRVLGQGNTQFDAFKFRTMYVNGDDLLTAEQRRTLRETHKLRHDPRITPVGHVLRKYSLDELPQLINVLRGEMSLIGPRMITPMEKEKYGKWDMNLLTVKPGISGLWQVSGRSDLSYEERVQLDMHYIRNYTIWLDLHLCLETIRATIKGKGAY